VLDTLMVRADGPVRGVRELAGRRVAYAVEPFDRVMFQAMAQHSGLAPDSWTFVDVGFEFTRALLEGRADAVMGAFRNYEVIEAEELGMPVRIFELADHGVPPFYQLVFVARDDLTAAHAGALSRTLARVTAGIALTRAEPARATADLDFQRPSVGCVRPPAKERTPGLLLRKVDERESIEPEADVV